jgi:pimeloyl-ACP methyl ester carboxylesterase
VDTRIIDLPDGRELAYAVAGAATGLPVLAFHGTPGSRHQLLLPSVDGIATAAGVRLVVPDRPGYGHSTFQPGRRFVDWPRDVSTLADRLGVERFAVLGFSGGGPHALVCAALLADRVTRASVVSGIGPMSGPADTEGMMRANVVIASLARRSERALLPMALLMTSVAKRRPEQAIRSMAKQLPPADVAAIRRPDVFDAFVREARLAPATAARAMAQDMALFARPWGFELSSVAVPVDFWQGDADRNVPPAHARRQSERVEGSKLHEIAGGGHFMGYDHIAEILQALVAS